MSVYRVFLRKRNLDGTDSVKVVATNSASLARRAIERGLQNKHLIGYSCRSPLFEQELLKAPGLGTTPVQNHHVLVEV